jgi:hypothetical protein
MLTAVVTIGVLVTISGLSAVDDSNNAYNNSTVSSQDPPNINIDIVINSTVAYEFDLNKEAYIVPYDLKNVNDVLQNKGLDFSEYFAVSTLYGASFITPIKELPALKYDKVIDEDFDPDTNTLTLTVNRFTLIVWVV